MEMNREATRSSIRRSVTALAVLVIILGVLASQPQDAKALGHLTYYGPYDDGCLYGWDGAAWTEAQCPQSNGTTWIYAMENGQWVFEYQYEVPLTVNSTTYSRGCFASDWKSDGFTVLLCVRDDGRTIDAYIANAGRWVYVEASGGSTSQTNSGVDCSQEPLAYECAPTDPEKLKFWLALKQMRIDGELASNRPWLQSDCSGQRVGNICYLD